MTSSDALPGQTHHGFGVEDLNLSSYLDVLPHPALVFTFNGSNITADSLEVYYANQAVWETIGQQPISNEETFTNNRDNIPHLVARDFKTLLHAQLLNPLTGQFIQWLNDITQHSKLINHLKTRFRGYGTLKESPVEERTPQLVDIEWNGVFMEKKYIVLTGRRTGIVQFSAVSADNTPDISTGQLPSPIDEEDEETQDIRLPAHYTSKSASSSSSNGSSAPKSRRKAPKRAISSATTLSSGSRGRLSSYGDGDDGNDIEIDPWRNEEKVYRFLEYF